MKIPIASLTSVLVAAIVTVTSLPRAEPPVPEPLPEDVESGTSTPVGPASGFASLPSPSTERGQFRRAQLESADYQVNVANLRRIGCPEATIRDLIRAAVHAHEQRRADTTRQAAARFLEAGFGRNPGAEFPGEEEALVTVLLGGDTGAVRRMEPVRARTAA